MKLLKSGFCLFTCAHFSSITIVLCVLFFIITTKRGSVRK